MYLLPGMLGSVDFYLYLYLLHGMLGSVDLYLYLYFYLYFATAEKWSDGNESLRLGLARPPISH